MMIVAVYDTESGLKAQVNAVNEDGTKTIDVSDQYEVKELLVTDESGNTLAGWFVGKPCETPTEVNA